MWSDQHIIKSTAILRLLSSRIGSLNPLLENENYETKASSLDKSISVT